MVNLYDGNKKLFFIVKALFNANGTLLSRFPPQDILTLFHQTTDTPPEDHQIYRRDFFI